MTIQLYSTTPRTPIWEEQTVLRYLVRPRWEWWIQVSWNGDDIEFEKMPLLSYQSPPSLPLERRIYTDVVGDEPGTKLANPGQRAEWEGVLHILSYTNRCPLQVTIGSTFGRRRTLFQSYPCRPWH